MNRRTTSEILQAELDKKKQVENRIKTLQKQQNEEQRKARTRRLIERGAIIESLIENPADLTNEQFKKLVKDALTVSKSPLLIKNAVSKLAEKAEVAEEAHG
jgi:iron-sulfur cluster repair protein YtfE (RIC family)